jgi:hypothetical protein
MLKLKSLIREGGNLFDGTVGIKQTLVKGTMEDIFRKVLKPMGLQGIDTDVFVLGSAGKKSANELSGDLDIGISADQIASANGLKLSEVYDWVIDTLESMGYETAKLPGFSQVSIAYPIKGDKGNYVQVDFMMSNNLEWTKFAYIAPDFSKSESKYKLVYRNLLLAACVSIFDMKVLKQTKDKIPVEVRKYALRWNDGVYSTVKSFASKTGGILKVGKLLKDKDVFVTQTPEELVDMFLGSQYTPNDIRTFEGLYDIVFNQESNVKRYRNLIKQKFIESLTKSKLPIPELLDM